MAEEVQTTTPVAEAEQTQAATEEATVAKPTGKRKKSRRTVANGQIHVMATFNNTIITVTDPKGNTLATASAGALGFRGSKKGTAYAAVRTLINERIQVEMIRDVTGVPHGGTRPRKQRRT
jgi:small subunit ribosomal protein S11